MMGDAGQRLDVIVMATTDETAIAIARSILDGEGIAYTMSGAGLRKFGGNTFLGATMGPMMGQAFIKVAASDKWRTAELLRGLVGAVEEYPDDG